MRACHCAFSSRGASTRPTAACSRPTAPNSSTFEPVDWKSIVAADRVAHVSGGVPPVLSFCDSKAWLLDHMPTFDLHFLPGSVAVNGTSMLDDNIAFVLMADRAAPWSASIPMEIKFSYLLPYASYHESRQNWRPLFFAKFFGLVANATSVEEAVGRLVAPNAFTEWSEHYWPSSPRQPGDGSTYDIRWSSSTAPPIVSPLEFIAYGYGSCSAWATMVTYVARAVGLPARQAGTPCWNSVYASVDYRGLALTNPNVSLCWGGGSDSRGHGGGFLNNHNWCEVYLPPAHPPARVSAAEAQAHEMQSPEAGSPEAQAHEMQGAGEVLGAHQYGAAADGDSAGGARWAFVNVPPASKTPDDGLCGAHFDSRQGCGFDSTAPVGHECDGVSGGPGAAMRDHPIFAASWDFEGELQVQMQGGEILDVSDLRLSDGQPATPLVWSPKLASPLGERLSDIGLRMVNRTAFYRCKPRTTTAHP